MKSILCLALLANATLSAQFARPYRADLFDHVQSDLDRAAHDSYPNGRIEKALRELNEFRVRYNSGRSAKHELDTAIAAVRALAKSDVLRPRDRDIIQNDLITMRQFRENYRAGLY